MSIDRNSLRVTRIELFWHDVALQKATAHGGATASALAPRGMAQAIPIIFGTTAMGFAQGFTHPTSCMARRMGGAAALGGRAKAEAIPIMLGTTWGLAHRTNPK